MQCSNFNLGLICVEYFHPHVPCQLPAVFTTCKDSSTPVIILHGNLLKYLMCDALTISTCMLGGFPVT